jgi:hypothetical protein
LVRSPDRFVVHKRLLQQKYAEIRSGCSGAPHFSEVASLPGRRGDDGADGSRQLQQVGRGWGE